MGRFRASMDVSFGPGRILSAITKETNLSVGFSTKGCEMNHCMEILNVYLNKRQIVPEETPKFIL